MIDHNDEREYLCFRCDGIDGAHEDVGNDEDCYKAEMQAVDQNHFKAMRYTLVITIVTVTIISTIIRNVMGPVAKSEEVETNPKPNRPSLLDEDWENHPNLMMTSIKKWTYHIVSCIIFCALHVSFCIASFFISSFFVALISISRSMSDVYSSSSGLQYRVQLCWSIEARIHLPRAFQPI